MTDADRDSQLASMADRFMEAASRPSAEPIDDRNIPVLTEFVDPPPHAQTDREHQAVTPAVGSGGGAPAILKSLPDDELDQLSHDIFQRVTERMDHELASKLEARLTQEINAKVRVAVANVLIDMRQTIANEIGDAVNAALADKLR